MSVKNQARRRSAAQVEASRLNGAKSTGPSSLAGQLKINEAHMTHGFAASQVCIHTEDQEAFTIHLNAYLARYSPIDKVEHDLVSLVAVNMWQVMRLTATEVALVDIDISGIEDFYEGQFETMDQYGRLALAFKKSAGDRAFDLLLRYKTRAERAYHRAVQGIETMQQNRPVPSLKEEISVKPEPAPEPEPKAPKPKLQLVPKPAPVTAEPEITNPLDPISPPHSPPSNP